MPNIVLNGAEEVIVGPIREALKAAAKHNTVLTGIPTAPTPAPGTNTAQIATTAFVLNNAVETTSSILTKLDGAANVANKIGAEYLPDALRGPGIPAPAGASSGSADFTGIFPSSGFTITVGAHVFTWRNSPVGLFEIRTDSPSFPTAEASKLRNAINSASIGMTATVSGNVTLVNGVGASANGGIMSGGTGGANHIGQEYHNTATGVWYRWNGTAWQEDAVGKQSVASETPPPSPVEGDLWRDKSDNSLAAWDSVESAWISASGPSSNLPIGPGVAAALALPIGTTGAVQRNGDPLTPTSIVLPDMTGIIAPARAIGLKNGALALSDGVTPGGVLVGQRRLTGTGMSGFGNQPKSLAFCKLIGIPFLASEFIAGREFKLTGHLILRPVNSLFDNITNLVFGTTFNAGSVVPFINTPTTKNTNWGAKDYTLITSLNVYQPIRFDIVDGHRSFVGTGSGTTGVGAINFTRSLIGVLSSYYDADNEGEGEYFAATAGEANTLWFMVQLESSNPGNYLESFLEFHYDLTLEFTN